MKGFAGRLKAIREKRCVSQHELADMVGIHLSQLSRLERGASLPSAETVLALARALHTTADALLRGDRNGEERLEIENVRLYERFRMLLGMKHDDQETVIRVIDAVIAKRKMEEVLQGG